MLRRNAFALVTLAMAATAAAQVPPEPPPGVVAAPLLATETAKAGGVTISIDGMDASPVKGAPFCAVVTTEHTQPFADGNRIHTTEAPTLCRDSEGRTRREASLNLLGAAPQKSGAKLVTIIDPAAGFRYVLDPDSKTARKMALPPMNFATGGKRVGPGADLGAAGVSVKDKRVMVFRTEGAHDSDVFFGNVFVNKQGSGKDEPPPAKEDLGDQTIEGIHATGTRLTTTIPSGRMGNEQPIVVTSERWYSPELKATVMTKHNDPWAGELKTQFTSVNTAEPDSSLFVVPSDYKVVDEEAGPFRVQLPPPAPPAQ
jgi:hypothetical protein